MLGGVPKTKEAPGTRHNDLAWEVFPEGLYVILQQLARRYNRPILITENGMAEALDKHRASYIIAHVQQVQRARSEGVDVIGYLHWSIVDNYEWAYQYEPRARFGLFRIHRVALDLLGRHVGRCAHHLSRGGQALAGMGERACQSKVQQHRLAL